MVSEPAYRRSAAPTALDAAFDVRWEAWRTRGLAHERAVRRTLTLVGGVAAALATTVAVVHTFLRA